MYNQVKPTIFFKIKIGLGYCHFEKLVHVELESLKYHKTWASLTLIILFSKISK
jgi:hypothetical protein